MTAADTHAPFLRAIIAAPDDDLPRLIFADWLDEHDDGERAEFIRVQCELARLPNALHYHAFSGKRCRCSFCILERRERKLSICHCGPWLQRELSVPNPGPWIETGQVRYTSQRKPDTEFIFRRGFVESVTCTAADWLRHHAAIRAATPLRRAVLTTPAPELECQSNTDWRKSRIRFPGLRWWTIPELFAVGGPFRDTLERVCAAYWPGVAIETRSGSDFWHGQDERIQFVDAPST